ncbi:hypothetical protein G7K_2708-t1 [Saitoella complicata NRRL Y-17804]|uniref:Uncharacterized protein n=1 Tax=Saitoella complicata (strain BCRC 22490 / CBS 7301 / JCM 7358 / NBRC 10748 / NRRL Y-17804) TaxID=698492 RepID=A0A0E9NGK2_SAICN|nr:hypothetical protein G7K_2708-t1 [Saitoella complicata NRRL Y-17804]
MVLSQQELRAFGLPQVNSRGRDPPTPLIHLDPELLYGVVYGGRRAYTHTRRRGGPLLASTPTSIPDGHTDGTACKRAAVYIGLYH